MLSWGEKWTEEQSKMKSGQKNNQRGASGWKIEFFLFWFMRKNGEEKKGVGVFHPGQSKIYFQIREEIQEEIGPFIENYKM